jgi:phospholipid-binding lipoprotein MlaA
MFISNSKIFRFLLLALVIISITANPGSSESKNNGVNDPFEGANRNIFKFNEKLDDYFFKPVAKGWRKLPDIPRKPLTNLADTAKVPVSLANAILQLNKESIGNILGRFLVNMTFGLGGLFDVASTDNFGNMPNIHEDFGQTLAVWGVPDGPYVMLPIFGPSSLRDSVGMGIDAVTNPLSFAYRMNGIGIEGRLSGPVVRGVTKREKYLDYVDEMKAGSLDWYATMRSLYRQRRIKEISGELENEKVSFDLIPTDVYQDDILNKQIVNLDTDNEIENVVKTQLVKTQLVKTQLVKEVKAANKRYYNGILPSSNYPAFNESRVNLIE